MEWSELEELNKEIAGAQVVKDVVECHLDTIIESDAKQRM